MEGAPHASDVYLDQCYCFPLHSIGKLASICICMFDSHFRRNLYVICIHIELFSVTTIIVMNAEEKCHPEDFFLLHYSNKQKNQNTNKHKTGVAHVCSLLACAIVVTEKYFTE